MQEEKQKRSFHNPYEGMTEVGRVTTDISRADYMLIKLLRPTSGTISGTLGLLWSKLCFELRERNITDNAVVEQFETFVANCRIISNDEYDSLSAESAQWRQYQASRGQLGQPTAKPRSTTRRSMRASAPHDVRQRTQGLGSPHTAESEQLNHIQEQSRSTERGTEGSQDK